MSVPYPPDIATALASPDVAPRLGLFAGRLTYHPVVPSTNDVALSLVTAGASPGACVVAGQQTAGRGRRGRSWFSPKDVGIYTSVVLGGVTTPTVTLLAGVAAAEAIRAATDVPVELEWPNDLVVRSRGNGPYQRAKLGGVLTEAAADPAGTALVIVGIGVNVTATEYPSDLRTPVACLESHATTSVVRGVVLVEILAALAAWYDRVEREGAGPLLQRWRELSSSCEGVTVAWDLPEGRRSGVTAGIDVDGALRVRVGDRVERIVGGTLDWQVDQ